MGNDYYSYRIALALLRRALRWETLVLVVIVFLIAAAVAG
jgi:hypothetical protein